LTPTTNFTRSPITTSSSPITPETWKKIILAVIGADETEPPHLVPELTHRPAEELAVFRGLRATPSEAKEAFGMAMVSAGLLLSRQGPCGLPAVCAAGDRLPPRHRRHQVDRDRIRRYDRAKARAGGSDARLRSGEIYPSGLWLLDAQASIADGKISHLGRGSEFV
jgi:hypothetical protein